MNLNVGALAKKNQPVKIKKEIKVEKKLKLEDLNKKINEFDNKLNKLEDIPKYNLDKNLINEKLNKQSIKKVEQAKMVIPKIEDNFKDMKATDFLSKVLSSNYNEIFKDQPETIYSFLDTINKKIKEDEFEDTKYNKITLNDFKTDTSKAIDENKVSEIITNALANHSEVLDKKEEIENIPLFNHNDRDTDFKVMDMCYDDKFEIEENKSNIRSTDMYDSQEEYYEEEEDEGDNNEDEDEHEKVVVEKEENNEVKELLDLKEKFDNKINYYREQAKKSEGEECYKRIYDYYQQIYNDDDCCDKIYEFIRKEIPANKYQDVYILVI
jgi:hypothetical protein